MYNTAGIILLNCRLHERRLSSQLITETNYTGYRYQFHYFILCDVLQKIIEPLKAHHKKLLFFRNY